MSRERSLFAPETTRIEFSESWVEIESEWLAESQSNDLFEFVQRELSWEQRDVSLFGKKVAQPRLIAWCGEQPYRYSGLTLSPRPWPERLKLLLAAVSARSQVPFNHLLLNRYRNGRDWMGFHADNEKMLGQAPAVATLSLGSTRRFVIKPHRGNKPLVFELEPGSLLLMGGLCQQQAVHSLSKTSKPVNERISLTFRELKGEPGV